ncbi:MAG: hypothetical protein ACLTAI_12155 [Thomasclavelia sp.]
MLILRLQELMRHSDFITIMTYYTLTLAENIKPTVINDVFGLKSVENVSKTNG